MLLFTLSHLTKAIPTWKTSLAWDRVCYLKEETVWWVPKLEKLSYCHLQLPSHCVFQPWLFWTLRFFGFCFFLPIVHTSHIEWSIINENNRTMHVKLVKKKKVTFPQMQTYNKSILFLDLKVVCIFKWPWILLLPFLIPIKSPSNMCGWGVWAFVNGQVLNFRLEGCITLLAPTAFMSLIDWSGHTFGCHPSNVIRMIRRVSSFFARMIRRQECLQWRRDRLPFNALSSCLVLPQAGRRKPFAGCSTVALSA